MITHGAVKCGIQMRRRVRKKSHSRCVSPPKNPDKTKAPNDENVHTTTKDNNNPEKSEQEINTKNNKQQHRDVNEHNY